MCKNSFKEIGFLDDENLKNFIDSIDCPSCSSSLIKVSESIDIFPLLACRACGEKFGFEDLLPDNKQSNGEHLSYCNSCEHPSPCVGKIGEDWICFSCFSIHSETEVGHCGYCNEFVAGNLEDSYLSGCLMCSGQMGHYMNSSNYD